MENFLKKNSSLFEAHFFCREVQQKLLQFNTRGKMLRGSLVIGVYELFENSIPQEVIDVATALELIHGSLLIHDDIMDNDKIRRGEKSIYAQYSPDDFGKSMAICIGDTGFFLAYQLLSASQLSQKIKDGILSIFSKELVSVTLAQMQDVNNGYIKEEITENQIEQVYRYKTGRYTFALPFMVGAMLANQNAQLLSQFEKLGEDLGLLFQIKDDEIGLFGKIEKIGKPVGADIRENKKTLYRQYLFAAATTDERKKLETIFGNDNNSENNISFVYDLLKQYAINEKIKMIMAKLKKEIEQQINSLTVDNSKKQFFYDLVTYSLERDR